MALDPTMNTALQAAAPLAFCALEMALPDHDIRALDGSGVVSFNGLLFTGSDDTYGTLNGIETITESVATEAPKVRFSFLPKSMIALASLVNPVVQGSEVTFWFGVVNPATGLVMGVPEVLFVGELDEAEVSTTQSSQTITFDVASAWERLFDANEGARMNDAYQQSLYAGDLAFQYITGVQENIYWGFRAP